MTMNDWVGRLHEFLTMTGRELLTHAVSISHDAAMQKAHGEYDRFRFRRMEDISEVERHFVEAEQELRQIEASRKRDGL